MFISLFLDLECLLFRLIGCGYESSVLGLEMREYVYICGIPFSLFFILVDNPYNLHTQISIILEVKLDSWLLVVTQNNPSEDNYYKITHI